MNFETRPLVQSDVTAATKLDHKWFGQYGITKDQLSDYINRNPDGGMTLLADGEFQGFATFEILDNKPPSDYVGDISRVERALFIQQFTTSTNYSITDNQMDTELLRAVEQLAMRAGCVEVWEALSTKHPYSKKVNVEFDAFGFYLANGYTFDPNNTLNWSPGEGVSIPCYLFRKKLK